MTSPITGEEMTLHTETRELHYKGKLHIINYQFYKCSSGAEFTTDEIDQQNLDAIAQTKGFTNYQEMINQ